MEPWQGSLSQILMKLSQKVLMDTPSNQTPSWGLSGLRMSKSRTDLHLKSNIITWFSSLIIYNNCFIWIMNLASCIWSKIHGFSLKMHDLLCTALHQPMRELVCWQLTNGRLSQTWIMNLESLNNLWLIRSESLN